MELHKLRTFAAVAELGSLTQAAERLHLSQPAASAQIKMLEEEFGVALFKRKPSGLSLTPAGALLLPQIQSLLMDATEISKLAKALSGRVAGSIKFATVANVFDKSLLRVGEMMNLVVMRHSLLDIEVHQRNSRSIFAGVANDEFDTGLALGGRGRIKNIRRIFLKELHYRIVAPASWRDRIDKMPWSELAASPWISAPAGGSHHQMELELFTRYGFAPAKVIEADSEPVIASLVNAGVGLGLMREDLALEAEKSGTICVVGKARPSTFLQVVYRAGRESDPAVRAILDILRELWLGEDRKPQIRAARR